MIIGGLQKFSLLDYPDEVSAIIFTFGCNFRCQYCYNPTLVYQTEEKSEKREGHPAVIKEDDLFLFLKNRIKKIDAIVISGGEPTIYHDLPEFIKKIRDLGFKIKLDTNGTNPEMLKKLIDERLIDYIAMDIKNSFENYSKIVGNTENLKNVLKSIIIIKRSNLPHEFRTTIVPGLIGFDDIYKIGEDIRGGEKWYLQQFKRDAELINNKCREIKPYSRKELEKMREIGRNYVGRCEIR